MLFLRGSACVSTLNYVLESHSQSLGSRCEHIHVCTGKWSIIAINATADYGDYP